MHIASIAILNDSCVPCIIVTRPVIHSCPSGLVAGIVTFVGYEVIRNGDASLNESRTAATIILLAVGLSILISISRPLRVWKLGLAIAMALSYVFIMFNDAGQSFFELDLPPDNAWLTIITCSVIGVVAVGAVSQVFKKTFN